MVETEQRVRALIEGDDNAKMAALRALRNPTTFTASPYTLGVYIANAGGIAPLVELLRDGRAEAKARAAEALYSVAIDNGNQVRIAEAGGIPPLLELLRDGSAEVKWWAAHAVRVLARNDGNKILISQAGGLAPLVQLVRDGRTQAKQAALALRTLATNNDANAIAIAVTVGLEALVQLARRGCMCVEIQPLVYNASVPAKRKAALVVAALIGDCVPESVPRVIKAVIGSYL